MKKSSRIIAGAAMAALIIQGTAIPTEATYAVYAPRMPESQNEQENDRSSAKKYEVFDSYDIRSFLLGDTGIYFIQIRLFDPDPSLTIQDISVSWTNQLVEYDGTELSSSQTAYFLEEEDNGTLKLNLIPPKTNFPVNSDQEICFSVEKLITFSSNNGIPINFANSTRYKVHINLSKVSNGEYSFAANPYLEMDR